MIWLLAILAALYGYSHDGITAALVFATVTMLAANALTVAVWLILSWWLRRQRRRPF